MSKKKYKKRIGSLKKEINLHRDIKLQKALEEENTELAGYYEKEIKRLEDQLAEKETKLLPRREKLKLKKKKL
ncbi:hypothetical protein CMO93_04215 [Candidatus Woesearchaeota archaeon]|nr:hypothetical protein [Candidatus Woesearchaeota archaeon]|tara:strand:+ start:1287 stop:1505 length:219 start_codon:yes stop_codon:yes gene_type:complete